jgi:hypothetical protein
VSNFHITYAPRPDATPEVELDALAAIYRVLLDAHDRKNAAPVSHPDAARENTEDETRNPSPD